MKYTLTSLKHLLIIANLAVSPLIYAIDANVLEHQADSFIEQLYHRLKDMPNTSMVDRIDWFSASFKGKVYVLGSLGEGPEAKYDQFPRYRVDGFDCDTYVNTVLALASADSLSAFKNCINHTRYYQGNVSYINRNHFTSIDWNKNNQQRGLLKDITLNIKDQNHRPVAKFAHATINKPGWYSHKTLDTIRLQHPDPVGQKERLEQLKVEGSKLPITESVIAYIPFTVLFAKDNKPNLHLFSQIPHGAIIEIIRPNWNLHQQIGTNLNVSHLGFAIRTKNELYFRQASSQFGKVVDVPLVNYLQQALDSPTIKGINIQIVVPKKPVSNDCEYFKIE